MQTILDLNRRPVVAFDVSNAEHRRYVSDFLKSGTWSHSPVAFYAPEGISARAFAMESLVSYYLQNEFQDSKPKKTVKQSGRLIAV
jgi:hypothetical protein